MLRRTRARIVAATLTAALLTGCGDGDSGTPARTASALPAAASGGVVPDTRSTPTRAATPAARYAPARGFPVAVRRLDLRRGPGRPLPTTVWYPRTGDGPFPLIVFSHGLTSQPQDYARLLTHWARAGFVVAGAAYPHTSYGVRDFDPLDVVNQPADASYVLSRVLALNGTGGDALAGRIATADVAAAGHSAGGITTVGLFSGDRDERLRAGVVLAGRRVLPAPFTGPQAPLLFVHGRRDRTVPYADGRAAFDAVPWPKAMMAITAGGHLTTDRDFAVVAATTTDFWRWSLYGDRAARSRLNGDATEGGVATFKDEL